MSVIDDFSSKLISINKNIKNINGYIKENKHLMLKEFLTTTERERIRKQTYDDVLKREKNINIEEKKRLEDEINYLCTFDFNFFTNFLCDVLSIMENETYIKINFNFSYMSRFKFLKLDVSENVCLITSYQNMLKIKELKKQNKLEDSISIMDSLENEKYILLEKNKTYNIYDFDNNSFKNELLEFPYLKSILKTIIDIKKESNLIDEEIFNEVLDKITVTYKDDSKKINNIK